MLACAPIHAAVACAGSITGPQLAPLPKFDELPQSRGYGCADTSSNTPTQPDSLFRIASVSKTFTAIAILQLVEAGKLSLSDAVFGKIPANFQPLPGRMADPQIEKIAVQDLEGWRSGGWPLPPRRIWFVGLYEAMAGASILWLGRQNPPER